MWTKSTTKLFIGLLLVFITSQAILDAFKVKFKPIQKNRLDILVEVINQRSDLSTPEKAYILATAWHESDQFKATKEYLSDEKAELHYGCKTSKGLSLGNTNPGDGAKYKGRGFVQLTGKSNYKKAYKMVLNSVGTTSLKVLTEEDKDSLRRWNFETNPELVSNPRIASIILIDGMKQGLFTGKALNRYIINDIKDYRGARRTVNGLDKAILISSYAVKLEKLFKN